MYTRNILTEAFSVLAWITAENNGAHHEMFNAGRLELKTWLVHLSLLFMQEIYYFIHSPFTKVFDLNTRLVLCLKNCLYLFILAGFCSC